MFSVFVLAITVGGGTAYFLGGGGTGIALGAMFFLGIWAGIGPLWFGVPISAAVLVPLLVVVVGMVILKTRDDRIGS